MRGSSLSFWAARVKPKRRPRPGWQAVPGYRARRFKVGARILRALKGLPSWAKVAPAVAAIAFVATLCAGRVAGNPASQGGFSDTETVSMSFQAGAWGCSGGDGGCAVGENVYGYLLERCGKNSGTNEGGPGQNGGPNGDNLRENGGGNAAGEGNGGGNTGSAADNVGSAYDGAAENAALATGATDTPGDTGGAGTGESAGSSGQAGDDAASGGGGNSGSGK